LESVKLDSMYKKWVQADNHWGLSYMNVIIQDKKGTIIMAIIVFIIMIIIIISLRGYDIN